MYNYFNEEFEKINILYLIFLIKQNNKKCTKCQQQVENKKELVENDL